ncbi:MAG: hypothetical protein LBR16_01535 [Treponema sp.]|jgi:hypothetical protein|nr:hypothetical protein [Treponema sp.]
MKNRFAFLGIVMMVCCCLTVWAQEEAEESPEDMDQPYLSEDDIKAFEAKLPEDTPQYTGKPAPEPQGRQEPEAEARAETQDVTVNNEAPRLGSAARGLYHLLIIDRSRTLLNSDISGIAGKSLLYKKRHGRNGYLIAVYTSPAAGPVFPVLPAGSRIVVNLSSYSKSTLLSYVNSAEFRRFVTSRTITRQIQYALR